MTMPSARHLGFESEYIINHLDAVIIERADYWVHQTPSNPHFYFGNFIELKVPLSRYSKAQWLTIFADEFSNLPEVKHVTLSWSRNLHQEQLTDFLTAGFEFEECHILAAKREQFKSPSLLNKTVRLQPITNPAQWQQWCDLAVKEDNNKHEEKSLREYLNKKSAYYQRLATNDFGETLGAFVGEQLIGYAGLFHLNDLARFN